MAMTTDLSAWVGRELAARGLTLAVAESCTGGLLGHRLTTIGGSSGYFVGGVIAYSNAVKSSLLGVEAALIESQGAVSLDVAIAMAEGVAARLGADIGVGITGIAGPDGGTLDKPVGLVFIAVAGKAGGRVRRCAFEGDRGQIKTAAADAALELLREYLVH